MIGLNRGSVGTSEAGRRIIEAGRAYQAAHPEPVPPKPAVVSPSGPPAAVAPSKPPRWSDRPLSGDCHRIIAETAGKHGVTAEAILSPRRSHKFLPAHFEAVYRCVSETDLSLATVGRVFHRDHTTIGASVMRHHHLTGAPLPRGMNWIVGGNVDERRRRNQRRKQLAAERRAP